MAGLNRIVFSSIDEAGCFIKDNVARDLHQSIQERGQASLVLPGGNQIKNFFWYIAQADVPWEHVTIGLCDERLVPVGDDRRNDKQLYEMFLKEIPNHRYMPIGDEWVQHLCEYPPVTILSMGIDGHVASLFPEEAELWKNQGLGLYTTQTQAPNRITLTEKALLSSRSLYVLADLKKRKDALLEVESVTKLESIYKARTSMLIVYNEIF